MLRPPDHDAFIKAGDLQFHYVQWGTQGPPVVCVHGLTANAFYFQAIAEGLARDYRVFAYDLRGRGQSERPEQGYSVPLHAADLAQLIASLGLEQPALLGHSLGAFISLYFAANYPDKLSKLILGDGGAPLPWNRVEDQPAWLNTSVQRLGMTIPSFGEYLARLQATPFLGPYWNEYMECYFQHDVAPQSDGSVISRCYREGILEEAHNLFKIDFASLWAEVTAPTLLLRAGQGLFQDNDQLLTENSAQALRQTIPNNQFVNFPYLNHYTLLFGVEQGPLEAIRAFLA